MSVDKALLSGSTPLLLMKLLAERDMYGYEMIAELKRRSDHTFDLKAGTLYPLLHALEQKGAVEAWEDNGDGARSRRYYHLTGVGRALLQEKEQEWREYSRAVTLVLDGGESFAY